MENKYKDNGGSEQAILDIDHMLGINNKSFANRNGVCGSFEKHKNDNEFFKSKQAEYLFYLTKLEGKQRNELLGLTDEHYDNKELAQKWYREISHCIHPDKGEDDKAFRELRKIYNVLIEN